ncbi:MAG: DUF1501 domain-containing protein [Acidobacteria bacterium]|nr:DUF1501 domain-containing protein [Acidobacteriota bacterium]
MLTRRETLKMLGAGFGVVGMADGLHAASTQQPHFAPRAKHVIFLYLNGGLSHVDSFDPKPELTRLDGRPMPGPKVKTDRASGGLMKSPFEFRPGGRSGVEVSDLFPKIRESIDDFCVIRSMQSDSVNHLPSMLMMNTGHALRGGSRPSFGSWVVYGLGSENQNLPGYVVLCPGTPTGGPRLWSSAFLPTKYEGAYIKSDAPSPEELIQDLTNKRLGRGQQERQLELLSKLDSSFLARTSHDPALEANIQSMEVAFRMQTEAPEVFDISKEPAHVQARYGDGEFGRGCLMALRLVESGVRIVQVYYGNGQPWDSHDDIMVHKRHARLSDGPIASLVADLKERGLLDETLIIVGSEFGRTPMIQNSGTEKVGRGRDHNPPGYSILLAGGGIRGGSAYGATDDFGYKAVENIVTPHDLHATSLHLLGLDHTKLTYRYSGRDYRLTDVHGNVLTDLLA